jgi:hypothetical protein
VTCGAALNPGEAAPQLPRAYMLLSRMVSAGSAARAGRITDSSGPVMSVVASAISTSTVKPLVDETGWEPDIERDQLGQPARVQ